MLKILLVDDSSYQRTLLRQSLQGRGGCHEAAGGQEACRLFAQALQNGEPFDLVILDILMPGMDGHEALRNIRLMDADPDLGGRRRTPVIMLSSLDDPGNMFRAQMEEGADAYLVKPYDETTLAEILRSLELEDNPLSDEDRESCEKF